MSLHVLLIDDDHRFLGALCEVIAADLPELSIATVDSGEAAMNLIDEHDYDAIVSDIRLPDMDGLMVMERIQVRRPSIPILLMTAEHDHDLGLRALKKGAYAFLPKPFDARLFMAWLIRAI